MSRPGRGTYRLSDDDLALGKRLLDAARHDGRAFENAYEAAALDARPQKVADLFLLLAGVGGVALRLRWPVQRGRPRSDADIDRLAGRVESTASTSLLDPELSRVLLRRFVQLDQPLGDAPTTRTALYTAAMVCAVAVDNSLERAGNPSDRERRFRSASRAVQRRFRVPPADSLT